MFITTKNLYTKLFFTALLSLLLMVGCGDYKPCEVLAFKICTECPSVAPHWQAACMCIENDTIKENGYKCIEAEEEDKIRCHANLSNWNEGLDSCEQLN